MQKTGPQMNVDGEESEFAQTECGLRFEPNFFLSRFGLLRLCRVPALGGVFAICASLCIFVHLCAQFQVGLVSGRRVTDPGIQVFAALPARWYRRVSLSANESLLDFEGRVRPADGTRMPVHLQVGMRG